MSNIPDKFTTKLNIPDTQNQTKDDYFKVKKSWVILVLIILSLYFLTTYSQNTKLNDTAKTTKQIPPKIYQSKQYKALKQQINFYQNRVDIKLKELEQLNNKTTSGEITQWLNDTLINKKQKQIDFNMDKVKIKKMELEQYINGNQK